MFFSFHFLGRIKSLVAKNKRGSPNVFFIIIILLNEIEQNQHAVNRQSIILFVHLEKTMYKKQQQPRKIRLIDTDYDVEHLFA